MRPDWLEIRQARMQPDEGLAMLGIGERQAISLAQELKAAAIIIDERTRSPRGKATRIVCDRNSGRSSRRSGASPDRTTISPRSFARNEFSSFRKDYPISF